MRFGFDFEILAMARQDKCLIKSVPVVLLNNSASSNVSLLSDGIKMLCEVYSVRRKIRRR